jgi:hypothetical protein
MRRTRKKMIPIKNNGWDLVQLGRSGKIYYFVGTLEADIEDLPTAGVGTGSVAIRQDGARYLYHDDEGWEELSGGGGGGGPVDYSPYLNGTITTIQNDTVTQLRKYALAGFENLSADLVVSLPELTVMGDYAMSNANVKSLTFTAPKVATIGSRAFDMCKATNPTELTIGAASISYGAFSRSTAFSKITLPNCNYVGQVAFENSTCDVVLSRAAGVATLSNTNAFNGHTGDIYVPAALVDQYKAATGWSTYASKIKAIQEV